ncbi:uncharacterized protein [Argopecten irradians]|uniref:uncharacterized protein n=1 Tax=Argopecten irradians TaxID=31199 RepID=UPI00371E0EC1
MAKQDSSRDLHTSNISSTVSTVSVLPTIAGTNSVMSAVSNVTMGTYLPQQPQGNSKRTITGSERRRFSPGYAAVSLALAIISNPVFGILAVLAYQRATRYGKDKKDMDNAKYLALSFSLGIIGASITSLTLVVVFVHTTHEDKVLLVQSDKAIKSNKASNVSKELGSLFEKMVFDKVKAEQQRQKESRYRPSSSKCVRLVDVACETKPFSYNESAVNIYNQSAENDYDDGAENNRVTKINMEGVSDLMMGKSNLTSLLELNIEGVNKTSNGIKQDSKIARSFEDTIKGGSRDKSPGRRKRNRTKRELNACQQLQQLLKETSIKVRMKMKDPFSGWIPVVVEISDHTNCVVVDKV